MRGRVKGWERRGRGGEGEEGGPSVGSPSNQIRRIQINVNHRAAEGLG